MRPLWLDGCSKQGGAGKGYADAGFDVIGIDIEPQPNHRGEFRQADMMQVLVNLVEQRWSGQPLTFEGRPVAGIHVSWPCQGYSLTHRIRSNEHPRLIAEGRQLLNETRLPWVMENVRGAPLRDPVELCGCMFPELNVYRERLFEFGHWPGIVQPLHQAHVEPLTKMGRPPRPGERMHVVGNFSGVAAARKAMGIDWMTRDGLREAIPPAYTQLIGEALMAHVSALVAA